MDHHSIAAEGLTARIAAQGAELVSLRAPDGTELVWQAGPAWPRHAPLLFPIVGRLAADTLRHQGRDYRMTQHGFARDLRFDWLDRGESGCRLLLTDDAETRAAYPFAFRLEVAYALAGGRLSVTMSVENTGTETLPASLGAHPAFVWPLRPDIAPEAHTMTFEHPEPAPIQRVTGGLLQPDRVPSPVEGRVLRLHDELFAADALIFDPLASRSLRYTAPGAPVVTVDWENCPQLGIWSKPAPFVCIEPWHGFASPVDFAGEFADKPGLLHVPPGETAQIRFGIGVALPSNHD
jgi:galactose mutarotase-like enzyme